MPGLKIFMLDKHMHSTSEEKLLLEYKPRCFSTSNYTQRIKPSAEKKSRRPGPLFRTDLHRVLEHKPHFTFSSFLRKFIR